MTFKSFGRLRHAAESNRQTTTENNVKSKRNRRPMRPKIRAWLAVVGVLAAVAVGASAAQKIVVRPRCQAARWKAGCGLR